MMATSDWKAQLKEVFQKDLDSHEKKRRHEEQARNDKRDAVWFTGSVIIPVFEEIRNELGRYKRTVNIVTEDDSVALDVYYARSYLEFSYKVTISGRFPTISVHCALRDDKPEIISRRTNSPITIDELTRELLAEHFVDQYNRFKRYFPES